MTIKEKVELWEQKRAYQIFYPNEFINNKKYEFVKFYNTQE